VLGGDKVGVRQALGPDKIGSWVVFGGSAPGVMLTGPKRVAVSLMGLNWDEEMGRKKEGSNVVFWIVWNRMRNKGLCHRQWLSQFGH